MKKTDTFLVLVLFLFAGKTFSQSPYHFSWEQEAGYLGFGALTSASGLYFYNSVKPLTPQAVDAMNRSMINRFDRAATRNNDPQAADWSDICVLGSQVLPALLMLNSKSRNDFFKIGVLYGEVALMTASVTLLTKSTTLRSRPFVLNETFDIGAKLTRTARFSFFSGHTSLAAANSFFFAKVFSDYFPDSKLKPYVWAVAAGAPAATAYFRVAAGKHYPSDVIVGYGVGAAIGILVPQLHKTASQNAGLSYYPGLGGGQLVYRF